ncbi:hypothetical protein N9Y89_01995 [bacterium]|nr:hypothetical protein [bacterium]
MPNKKNVKIILTSCSHDAAQRAGNFEIDRVKARFEGDYPVSS